jgi:hypothetical protein
MATSARCFSNVSSAVRLSSGDAPSHASARPARGCCTTSHPRVRMPSDGCLFSDRHRLLHLRRPGLGRFSTWRHPSALPFRFRKYRQANRKRSPPPVSQSLFSDAHSRSALSLAIDGAPLSRARLASAACLLVGKYLRNAFTSSHPSWRTAVILQTQRVVRAAIPPRHPSRISAQPTSLPPACCQRHTSRRDMRQRNHARSSNLTSHGVRSAVRAARRALAPQRQRS